MTGPLAYGALTGEGDAASYADMRVAQAWLVPLGGRGRIDGDGNAATLDWWTAGIAGGYEGSLDMASGNGWAGFGLGYMRSHGAVDARLSILDADSFNIGVHGGWENGPWRLTGAIAYGASRVRTERRIVFGGIDRTAKADYWAHSLGFSSEAAYGIDLGIGATLSPLATLDAGWSGHGGFTERGAGALNLTGASGSRTRFDTGLGLGLSHTVRIDTGTVTFHGRAVWEHAFGEALPGRSLSFAGSPVDFDVRGPEAARDRLRLGAGLAWDVAPDIIVRASYEGLFSGRQQSHGASVGLNIRF